MLPFPTPHLDLLGAGSRRRECGRVASIGHQLIGRHHSFLTRLSRSKLAIHFRDALRADSSAKDRIDIFRAGRNSEDILPTLS